MSAQLNGCIVAGENQVKKTATVDETFTWINPVGILRGHFGWFSSFHCCVSPLGYISYLSTKWLLTKHWRSTPELRRRIDWFFNTTLHDFEFAVGWPVFIAYPYVPRQSFRVYVKKRISFQQECLEKIGVMICYNFIHGW